MEHEREIIEVNAPVLEDSLDEALRAASSTITARHVILALLRQEEVQRHFGLSHVSLVELRSTLTGAPARRPDPTPRFLAMVPSPDVNACLEEHAIDEEVTLAVQLALLRCLLKGKPGVTDVLAGYGIKVDV